MKRDTIFKVIRKGIQLGVVTAVIIFFLVCGFLSAGINTLTAHTLSKMIIVGAAVFVGFRALKQNMQEFHVFHGLLMALILGLTTGIVLTGFEIAMYNLAGIQLAPREFANSGLSQAMLSILLNVEMMAWSIVGSLAALQYYKRPHRIQKPSAHHN